MQNRRGSLLGKNREKRIIKPKSANDNTERVVVARFANEEKVKTEVGPLFRLFPLLPREKEWANERLRRNCAPDVEKLAEARFNLLKLGHIKIGRLKNEQGNELPQPAKGSAGHPAVIYDDPDAGCRLAVPLTSSLKDILILKEGGRKISIAVDKVANTNLNMNNKTQFAVPYGIISTEEGVAYKEDRPLLNANEVKIAREAIMLERGGTQAVIKQEKGELTKTEQKFRITQIIWKDTVSGELKSRIDFVPIKIGEGGGE